MVKEGSYRLCLWRLVDLLFRSVGWQVLGFFGMYKLSSSLVKFHPVGFCAPFLISQWC